MLLHFGNNSKNARHHFGKAHGNKVCSFFCFYVCCLQKGLLAKIRCNKLYEYFKGFLSKKRVSYDLITPKRWERCCSEELLLKLALLKFNDFIEVFIIDIFFISTKREWLSYPCWIWLSGRKYPSRDFASSSKGMEIVYFSSLGMEMFPFPDFDLTYTSLILLIQSSNRRKSVKLSFSIRRFRSFFFEKPSDVLPLR